LGQLHPNLGEVKNVSINWKNLGKFQWIKSVFLKVGGIAPLGAILNGKGTKMLNH